MAAASSWPARDRSRIATSTSRSPSSAAPTAAGRSRSPPSTTSPTTTGARPMAAPRSSARSQATACAGFRRRCVPPTSTSATLPAGSPEKTMHETLHVPRDGGTFAAYVARPSVRPAPAIVVVHEVFGVNADIRETCEEFAAQGFLAVAPDLFWRVEPGLALTDQTEAERAKAQALYEGFDLDAGVSDIAAAMAFVRTLPGATGKVGVVGYCLGGLLSLLVAARHDPDAAVAYYPGSAERHLDDLSRMSGP